MLDDRVTSKFIGRASIRKDCHETGGLYDCLCDCDLSRGSEKSADKSGFGEHGEECLFLLLL